MTVQQSVSVRNAKLDVVETTIGASPVLELRTGAQPANCAAGATGTIVATITLPADWMANAASGQKAMAGTWQDLSADNAGSLAGGHYRIWDSTKTVCHEQGSITATGGGGDLTVDNTVVALGQQVTVTSWTKTAGNA